jgi:hypothetical protein
MLNATVYQRPKKASPEFSPTSRGSRFFKSSCDKVKENINGT